ncbi:MAG TPA: GNAT family N-acetyltransferase [Candidatus Tumulicola sp.]|jgi:predicted acetyltransferase
MKVVVPTQAHLSSYIDALRRGWSPDNLRPEVAREQLEAIAREPAAFLTGFDDPHGRGGSIVLPDGSSVPRLPSVRRWLWDGDFCGSIDCRWQPGTAELPDTCLGHIGYAVVPWKRGRGYATAALFQMLDIARDVGLPYVELTTAHDNVASQRVILANGGTFVERFFAPRLHGEHPVFRYRIGLAAPD